MLDRLNEMRYANPAHPLEREAARHAVQQQVLNNPRPVPVDFNFGHIEGQNPRVEIEGRHANQNAPPPILNDNNLVPPPNKTKDKDKEKQRAMLKIWLIY